ncbi:hypothetical protein BBJ28_00017935 [Nothophytophthora sp. Chile5]|nr:hypothetical protein BBJ28_00017935 [Nothophytophthora sp. Chile5]
MQDPQFRLRTMDAGQTIAPIPMPLSPGGNVRDYQERFEFWLAQRNVTLSSLRGDPLKERCYRHNFAQWRLRMSYDQPANSKYGSAATATRSPPRWHSRSPSRQRKRMVNTRGKSCPIETYNRLNDQILLNEKVEEDSLARMAAVIGEDKTTAVELRSRIYELRASIKIEKDKRDAAVAAVIAHDWEKKHEELALKLETLTASSVSVEHQDWHERCAAIAVKLEGKDKELAALGVQFKTGLESLTSLLAVLEETKDAAARRRLQKLSSQIGLEQASRAFLETERQMVFMRILKSSRHIQTLVKTQLGKNQSP